MDWDEVRAELEKPLDSKHVRPPAPGKYGEFIEGWHAIAEANRIFGHDGWSYSVVAMTQTNASQSGDKFRVGYSCHVRVSVDGVTREDFGFGQGHSKSEGDAHDSAVKEAVTDALKRALRTFGWPLGLALYDKTKANVADTAAIERQAHEDAGAKTKIRLMQTCDTLEELAEMWRELPTALKERKDVIEAKDARKNELMPDNPVAA